jgi:hypothetical protein
MGEGPLLGPSFPFRDTPFPGHTGGRSRAVDQPQRRQLVQDRTNETMGV